MTTMEAKTALLQELKCNRMIARKEPNLTLRNLGYNRETSGESDDEEPEAHLSGGSQISDVDIHD
jgi:hypothetical protein